MTEIKRATPDDIDYLVPLFDGYRQFYRYSSDLSAARAFLAQRLTQRDYLRRLAEECSNWVHAALPKFLFTADGSSLRAERSVRGRKREKAGRGAPVA